MKNAQKRTKTKMYPLVVEWQKSNQSKREFCEFHHIHIHTFTYWVRKYQLDQEKRPSSFVALEIDAPKLSRGASYLRYPNGMELHFSKLPSSATLVDLLKIRV